MRIIILVLFSTMALGQAKFEDQEFSGKVEEIQLGSRFAYEFLKVKGEHEDRVFRFHPGFGQLILREVRAGDQVTVKVKVNISARKNLDNKNNEVVYPLFVNESMLSLKKGNQWYDLTEIKPHNYEKDKSDVLIEKRVQKEFWYKGYRCGLIFDNYKIAYYMYNKQHYYAMEDIAIGQNVSFIASGGMIQDGYAYPIDSIRETYWYMPLKKVTGKIKSFLYKQNFVCIGMVLDTRKGDVKIGFPSDYAKEIRRFSQEGRNVTVYYYGYKPEKQLEPASMQALVSKNDTIRITRLYYGGADGEHEHKPIEVSGKISVINKSAKGGIISLIVGSDCYIEIDSQLSNQIGAFLIRGKQVSISGEERIRKEGEIYSKDYRIITPMKITVDGKEYMIN